MKLMIAAALSAVTLFAADVHTSEQSDDARQLRGEGAAGPSIRDVLTAARGANPLLCTLAAASVRNGGWNEGSDAPVSPLARAGAPNGNANIAIANSESDSRRGIMAPADVALLLESLGSDDACVQELAVRMLGRQRSDESVTGLLSRLSGVAAPLREVAALGLGLVRSPRSIEPLMRTLRDGEAGVRANAAWALGRQRAGAALRSLLDLTGDADERVRVAAVVSAGQIDSASSVPALLRVAQRDESPRVRRVAAWALGQLHARDAVDALGTIATSDRDPLVREMSVWAIGDMNGRTGAPVLSRILRNDSDERVRETAAWALGEIGDRQTTDALSDAVANDRSLRVRGTAAWGLGQTRVRGLRAPAGLVALIANEDDDVRLKAAWALSEIGDSSTLGAVRSALTKEDRADVRRALTRALIRSGGRSRGTLEELLQSKDASVREAAIRGLTGNDAMGPWPWPWPRPRPFP